MKQFIPYSTGIPLKLKNIGFDESCFSYFDLEGKQHWSIHIISGNPDFVPYRYNSMPHVMEKYKQYYKDVKCASPTYQQVIDWFRIKYKVLIRADWHPDANYFNQIDIMVKTRSGKLAKNYEYGTQDFKSYYAAINDAIKKAIKLVEK